VTVAQLCWSALALALAGGVACVLLSRRVEAPAWLSAGWTRWLDPSLMLILVLAGPPIAYALHALVNPGWFPDGQDWPEFSQLLRWGVLDGTHDPPVENRYPLYPWLAAGVHRLFDSPPIDAGMVVSIVSFGLLPAALFILGRQLLPRPLAVAAAVAPLLSMAFLTRLGPPTDYLLYTTLHVGTIGLTVAAIARGGWWRFLALGVAAALLMAAAAKALVVLLLVLPAALAGLVWHHRRRPRMGLLALAGLVVPLLLCWLQLGTVAHKFHSLESLMWRSQMERARDAGHHVPFPDGFGFDPEQPMEVQGWWRAGDTRALTHLPDTLRFLTRPVPENVPADRRWLSVKAGLEHGQPGPTGGIWFALVGALAAGFLVRRESTRAERWVPWVLASGFLLAVNLAFLKGLTGAMFEQRYALPWIALMPVMTIAGLVLPFRLASRATAWRDSGLPWLPLAGLLAAWMVVGVGPLGFPGTAPQLRQLAHERSESHTAPLWPLARTGEQLVVVDGTGEEMVSVMFWDDLVLGLGPKARHDGIHLEGCPGAVRLLLQPCALRAAEQSSRWVSDEPGRLEDLSPCIQRDTDPGHSLDLRVVEVDPADQP